MELNGEQKQTWPLNLWSLVPGGRENPLHNYRKKCKTELISLLPRKDTVQWEGVIGDLAKSEKSYKALYYGAFPIKPALFVAIFSYVAYIKTILNNLMNMKYATFSLLLKSFEHATAFLKYPAPPVNSRKYPKIQFLHYFFKAFTTHDININHLIMLGYANSSTC